MPNSSPLGGISLVIHILINVVVFTYRKISNLFKLSNENIIAKTAGKMTCKESEGMSRSIFSYSIIVIISMILSGNLLFMIYTLSRNESIQNYENKINNSIQSTVSSIKNNVSNTDSIVLENQIETMIPAKNEPSVIEEKIESANNLKLVDFMKNIGIVDTSFDGRANLALELGVVDSIEKYNGSPYQNEEIKQKLINILTAQNISQLIR